MGFARAALALALIVVITHAAVPEGHQLWDDVESGVSPLENLNSVEASDTAAADQWQEEDIEDTQYLNLIATDAEAREDDSEFKRSKKIREHTHQVRRKARTLRRADREAAVKASAMDKGQAKDTMNRFKKKAAAMKEQQQHQHRHQQNTFSGGGRNLIATDAEAREYDSGLGPGGGRGGGNRNARSLRRRRQERRQEHQHQHRHTPPPAPSQKQQQHRHQQNTFSGGGRNLIATDAEAREYDSGLGPGGGRGGGNRNARSLRRRREHHRHTPPPAPPRRKGGRKGGHRI